MLHDLLTPNLTLVICGTAAGHESAARQQYYAKPGNQFWPTLFATGLTPVQLVPNQYRDLLIYGIGLTDLAKGVQGMDHELDNNAFDRTGLTNRMLHYAPRYLCFNGKRAGQEYLQRKASYGLQQETIGSTRLFIAPSTSGAAIRWWDIGLWEELAARVGCTGFGC